MRLHNDVIISSAAGLCSHKSTTCSHTSTATSNPVQSEDDSPYARQPDCSHEQSANRDREVFNFPVQLTTSRIGNVTLLTYTLLFYYLIEYSHNKLMP